MSAFEQQGNIQQLTLINPSLLCIHLHLRCFHKNKTASKCQTWLICTEKSEIEYNLNELIVMHMKRGTQTLFKLSWRDKNYEHQINEVSVMFTWHFQAVYAIFIALFSTLHCTVFSSAVIQTLLTGTLPPAAAHLISGLFIFCLTNFSLTLKNRVMRVFNFLTVLCYCVDSAISDPGDGMHSENISASEMHTVLKVWMIKQMVSLTAVPPCHRGVNKVTGERRRRSARLRGMKAGTKWRIYV